MLEEIEVFLEAGGFLITGSGPTGAAVALGLLELIDMALVHVSALPKRETPRSLLRRRNHL